MSSITAAEARRLLGDRFLAPESAASLLGATAGPPGGSTLPFSADELSEAAEQGCYLLYRPDRDATGKPITLVHLLDLAARAEIPGFRGDDPWFVDRPFAASESVQPGWALFPAEPWRETLNSTYERADAAISRRAAGVPWRRRRAVEIAFDCFAVATARERRLLERAWDWSSTAGEDGGLLNLGGYTPAGLDVLSYSRAVKHGALGACPTLVRPAAG
jgi:hypothetical protein